MDDGGDPAHVLDRGSPRRANRCVAPPIASTNRGGVVLGRVRPGFKFSELRSCSQPWGHVRAQTPLSADKDPAPSRASNFLAAARAINLHRLVAVEDAATGRQEQEQTLRSGPQTAIMAPQRSATNRTRSSPTLACCSGLGTRASARRQRIILGLRFWNCLSCV